MKTSLRKKAPELSVAWEIFDRIVPLPREKEPVSPADRKALLSTAERRSLERMGSGFLGPFPLDEFGQLRKLFASLADSGGKVVSPAKFERHFALDGADWFPRRLYVAFLSAQRMLDGPPEAERLTLEGFREGVAACCRSSRAGMVQTLFDICNDSEASTMDEGQLSRVFEVANLCSAAAWRTAHAAGGSSNGGKPPASSSGPQSFRANKIAASVATYLDSNEFAGGGMGFAAGGGEGGGGGVSVQGLKSWVSERAPLLHTCLSTFMHTRCFLYGDLRSKGVEALPCCATDLPKSLPIFSPPQPEQASFLVDNYRAEIFALALSTTKLQGPWLRIFTSEEDGMSFNRIAFKLVGYGGPTLLIMRERETGAVWGGCADSPWKESNSFYGGEGAFLFRLDPDLKIIPSKIASNGNFQYLNLKGFSLPHGIGMGGTTEAFRFFLPEALDGTCVGRSACLTFEQGELCPHSTRHFELDAIEVWGVGGTEALAEALEAREKQRENAAAQIQKARQVDKSKFATNAFDKEFLLSKTFGGGGGNYNSNEDRRQGQS
ncbi:unnamed protein product [Ascophyllum nodosum]